MQYSNPSLAIVACTAPMARFLARRFNSSALNPHAAPQNPKSPDAKLMSIALRTMQA